MTQVERTTAIAKFKLSKTSMLKSCLCNYSDAYLFVNGKIHNLRGQCIIKLNIVTIIRKHLEVYGNITNMNQL